ncbi:uncharacterized protein [Rutidosis leptorrhynchoides]|uniref:uncharacterized protein n=1 Tax=Rutidosis leptorrhynchoides TaxID=125765 RepID=UPI003A9A5482
MGYSGGDAYSSVTLINKLNFGDPLYLHPSDTTSGTPIISIKLKGTENYNIWSTSMILALGTINKLGFINGTCVKSTTDDVLSAQWDRCNTVVLSWILATLTEEVYSGQIFNSLALNVWNDLKETYDKKDGSIIFNLHHKINSLKQNDSPLSEYYHNLNSLWKQYDSMVSSPPYTCGAPYIIDGINRRQKCSKVFNQTENKDIVAVARDRKETEMGIRSCSNRKFDGGSLKRVFDKKKKKMIEGYDSRWLLEINQWWLSCG